MQITKQPVPDSPFHLSGRWEAALEPAPCKLTAPPASYPLEMLLPGTVSQQALVQPGDARETGTLTDPFAFTGRLWLRRSCSLAQLVRSPGARCFLFLERTRVCEVWLEGKKVGRCDSLSTPHSFDLTPHLQAAKRDAERFAAMHSPGGRVDYGSVELVLCISNYDYPTRGGHLTSPDTQTNWLGVLGDIRFRMQYRYGMDQLRAVPAPDLQSVTITGCLHGHAGQRVDLSIEETGLRQTIPVDENCRFSVRVPLPPNLPHWSEYTPQLLRLTVVCTQKPHQYREAVEFGLCSFTAAGDHFVCGGRPVMLRGKHDAMLFPLTGAAPMDIESWMQVFRTAKEWGINHYRFHTCCPPEAAFAAADRLGIYMEPELPFWGTIHAPDEPEYNEEEQQYLLEEGIRILNAYGHHPSFVMFSLGNELWGSPEQLSAMIDTLRAHDPRILYTQGSNNFQHMPLQLPNEDFWTGVRTGKGRLLRGAFATCDAPLGHIQTDAPATNWDYEGPLLGLPDALHPGPPAPEVVSPELAALRRELVEMFEKEERARNASPEAARMELAKKLERRVDSLHKEQPEDGDTLEIQQGTGVVKVRAQSTDGCLVPTVPVVTHEIGQYNMFPDFREIGRYSGVLKPYNLRHFRQRLAEKGMLEQAEDFFEASGALARDCYKMELEAAMRSPHLAGFQLLDLQDYSGQGTALVGMLNAFMESKGLISPEEWRSFCGDAVPLLRFGSLAPADNMVCEIEAAVRIHRPGIAAQSLVVRALHEGGAQLAEWRFSVPADVNGYRRLGSVRIAHGMAGRCTFTATLTGCRVTNTWEMVFLPRPSQVYQTGTVMAHCFTDALRRLSQGCDVLLLPDAVSESVPGTYCTDFWNYTMFRQIAADMGKEEPVGTLGLCMDPNHPIVKAMYGSYYTTPQWFSILEHTPCAVLDDFDGLRPIVQMIDNVERCHRLGIVFEGKVLNGRLLVCTAPVHRCPDDPAMNLLYHALLDYIRSPQFCPRNDLDPALLERLFG